jgi:hypothetical protein
MPKASRSSLFSEVNHGAGAITIPYQPNFLKHETKDSILVKTFPCPLYGLRRKAARSLSEESKNQTVLVHTAAGAVGAQSSPQQYDLANQPRPGVGCLSGPNALSRRSLDDWKKTGGRDRWRRVLASAGPGSGIDEREVFATRRVGATGTGWLLVGRQGRP